MTETTPLDEAHAAMTAAPEDDAALLRFYEAVAETELFLLLTAEPSEDRIDPALIEVEGTGYVIAFDREDRLTGFTGTTSPYAGLSGRIIARMLAEAGLGLALNPEVAPSAFLMPPEAVVWLDQTLAGGPEEAEARVSTIAGPGGLPQVLLEALSRKLATAVGLAQTACLVGVTYDDGRHGHLLGVIGARDGAEGAIAGAVREALVFSGLDAGELDVAFFDTESPMAARLQAHGLRFDLPQPPDPVEAAPKAPGRDPDNPPILK